MNTDGSEWDDLFAPVIHLGRSPGGSRRPEDETTSDPIALGRGDRRL